MIKRYDLWHCDVGGDTAYLCSAELRQDPDGEWVRYEDAVKPPHFLGELCRILGWQGGTIHQVLAEVKRLKFKAEGDL